MGKTTVIVDTREKAPWTFDDLPGIVTVRGKLETADYSIQGFEDRIGIERKSLDDWVGTVMQERARFYRELERMRAMDFRCVIIEANVRKIAEGAYTSHASPESVFGFIAEIAVCQSVPVYLGGTRAESQFLAGKFLAFAGKRLAEGGPLR